MGKRSLVDDSYQGKAISEYGRDSVDESLPLNGGFYQQQTLIGCDFYLANNSSWHGARIQHDARKRPHDIACAAAGRQLDFSLLGNLQRVIHFDTKISHRAF